jgi:hypothetical protein
LAFSGVFDVEKEFPFFQKFNAKTDLAKRLGNEASIHDLLFLEVCRVYRNDGAARLPERFSSRLDDAVLPLNCNRRAREYCSRSVPPILIEIIDIADDDCYFGAVRVSMSPFPTHRGSETQHPRSRAFCCLNRATHGP